MVESEPMQGLTMDWPELSTDPISLRPITEGDREFLYHVYSSTREEELARVPWDNSQKTAFLQMQFSAQQNWYSKRCPDVQFQVILEHGRPIGRLYIQRRPTEIRVIDMALLPAYRNRGIGSHLLSGILSEARTRDLPVTAHVDLFNPAQRLYKRLGFRTVTDDGVFQLMKWNPGENGFDGRCEESLTGTEG
jgi:GNAT superfamily N-acetyltransferase